MKRSLFLILSLVLLMTFVNTKSILAQTYIPTSVEISQEKVKIDNKLFYVHRVLAKQTLYSISKKYNVSIDEIKEYNETIKEGLKVGTLLYIPVLSDTSKKVSDKTPNIKIPTKSDLSKKELKELKKHRVKWYETLDDISDKYDIEKKYLVLFNELDSEDVKKRQILYIPTKENLDSEPKKEPVKQKTSAEKFKFSNSSHIEDKEEVLIIANTANTLDINSKYYDYSETERTYKISIILPFNTDNGINNVSSNMMDFYSGTILALNDLRSQYDLSSFKINFIDQKKYQSSDELIASGELDASELIIGPILGKDIMPISNYSKINRIPLISPLDTRTKDFCNDNKFFFLFPILNECVEDNLINSFAEKPEEKHLLIHEKGYEYSNKVKKTIDSLNTKKIEFDTFSYGILEGREIDSLLITKLDTLTNHNNIFIASENAAFVSDVLRNLYLLKTSKNISFETYGPQSWVNFETLELEHIHLLHTHLSLPNYVNYSDSTTIEFIREYKNAFRTEPSAYAYRAYDITTYFISALCEYGREFPKYISDHKKNLIQSNAFFIKDSTESGFKNHGSKDVLYLPNWEISNW